MKYSTFSLMAAILAAKAAAEDLLFVNSHTAVEYELAGAMGYSSKVISQDEWSRMTTDDFSQFKAVILSDPYCSGGPESIGFASSNRATWSPAIQGNMVVIGTDPSAHFSDPADGKGQLMQNSIKFAASGTSPNGQQLTGLYLALSCYYDYRGTTPQTVEALAEFGEFKVRGSLGCYNDAHIVGSSPALGSLSDNDLSNWGCSVHEAFASYPTEGINGFSALAIARNAMGEGVKLFGDGSIGLPYIIARGATPSGCGNGQWNPELSEECDDGNAVNGDGCSLSCKCESGKPNGDGTCAPAEVCGDGVFQPSLGEMCDGTPGCTAECKCESGEGFEDGTCVPSKVCGDNIFSPELGEECDGNENCTAECKCEFGVMFPGACKPKPVTETITTLTTEVLSSTVLVSQNITSTHYVNATSIYLTTITDTAEPTGYRNVSITVTEKETATASFTLTEKETAATSVFATTMITTTAPGVTSTVFAPPPYATPSVGTGPIIIGVEIIVIIIVVVDCKGDKTSYITSTATHERPVWNTALPGYPCYVCALPDLASTTEGCFMTATTTSSCTIGASTGIANPSGGVYPTSIPSIGSGNGSTENKPPVVRKCATCAETTLDTCPKVPVGLPTAHIPIVEIEYTTEVPHKHKNTASATGHKHMNTSSAVGPVPTAPVVCHGEGCPVASALPVAPYPTGGPAVVAPYPTASGSAGNPHAPRPTGGAPAQSGVMPVAPVTPETPGVVVSEAPVVVVPVPSGTAAPSTAPMPTTPVFTGAASSNAVSGFVGAAVGILGLALAL